MTDTFHIAGHARIVLVREPDWGGTSVEDQNVLTQDHAGRRFSGARRTFHRDRARSGLEGRL